MNPIGIYVHIPFCKSKCFYCNFYSVQAQDNLIEKYVLSLIKEIKNNKYANQNVCVDTIFIGGGTPSILKSGIIALIINTIKKFFVVFDNAEITIEANPNSISDVVANEWLNAGVNRVSVGLQTSNNKLLKLIGRVHNYAEYVNAMKILKKVGFNNINTDIIIGLPKQKHSDIKHTITHAIKLGSCHISAYTLILENGTPLFDLVKNKKIILPKEEKVLGMFNYVLKLMEFNNFKRYEVSNFCLNNKICMHNYNCWKLHEYLGFGASAHGYINNVRYNNISDVNKYISNINASKTVIEEEDVLKNQDKFEEKLMLGLRLSEGINLKEFENEFNINLLSIKSSEIKNLLNLGLIAVTNNRLKATKSGFYVLNKIILDLI